MELEDLDCSSQPQNRIRMQVNHDINTISVWFDFAASSMYYTLDGSIPTTGDTSITRCGATPTVIQVPFDTMVKVLVNETTVYSMRTPSRQFQDFIVETDSKVITTQLRLTVLDDPDGSGAWVGVFKPQGYYYDQAEIPDPDSITASSTLTGSPSDVYDAANSSYWQPNGNNHYIDLVWNNPISIDTIALAGGGNITEREEHGPTSFRIEYKDIITGDLITLRYVAAGSVMEKLEDGTKKFPGLGAGVAAGLNGWTKYRFTFTEYASNPIAITTILLTDGPASYAYSELTASANNTDAWKVYANQQTWIPGTSPATLEIGFQNNTYVGGFQLNSSNSYIPAITFEYWDGAAWQSVYTYAGGAGTSLLASFSTPKSNTDYDGTVRLFTQTEEQIAHTVYYCGNQVIDNARNKLLYTDEHIPTAVEVENYEIIQSDTNRPATLQCPNYINDTISYTTYTLHAGSQYCYTLEFDVPTDVATVTLGLNTTSTTLTTNYVGLNSGTATQEIDAPLQLGINYDKVQDNDLTPNLEYEIYFT